MRQRRFTALITIIVITVAFAVISSGCSQITEGWHVLQDLFDGSGNGNVTDTSDTDTTTIIPDTSNSDETIVTSSDPGESTEPPEGDEFVRSARMLDRLIWDVGEQIFYIDLNNMTLHHRYDIKIEVSEDDESESETITSAPIDEMLIEDVSAIVGFSEERIFCLSTEMRDSEGRVLHDVVAAAYDGNDREIVAYSIENAAVIDDNWLLISRYSTVDETDDPPTGEVQYGPLEIVVINLKKQEEYVIFSDDGNVYPGMDQTDMALGCYFYPEDDGIRVEVAYPGYSEYPYMRYLLYNNGEIVQDSKTTAWEDNLGEFIYEQGMAVPLQEVKIYNDLAIHKHNAGESTTLIYDHPDKSFEILSNSNYYVIDFFFHQGHVLIQYFDPDAGIDESQLNQLIYDPADDSIETIPNVFDNFYQFGNNLAGLKIERLGEDMSNNVEGRFTVDLVDANGAATETLFEQVLKTGSIYGDISYRSWRAGHDLVIYYETHQPDTGEITATSHNWIFISLIS